MNLIIMIHQVNWLKETWIEAFYQGSTDDNGTRRRSVKINCPLNPSWHDHWMHKWGVLLLQLVVMLLVDFVEDDYFDLTLDSGLTLKVN